MRLVLGFGYIKHKSTKYVIQFVKRITQDIFSTFIGLK